MTTTRKSANRGNAAVAAAADNNDTAYSTPANKDNDKNNSDSNNSRGKNNGSNYKNSNHSDSRGRTKAMCWQQRRRQSGGIDSTPVTATRSTFQHGASPEAQAAPYTRHPPGSVAVKYRFSSDRKERPTTTPALSPPPVAGLSSSCTFG